METVEEDDNNLKQLLETLSYRERSVLIYRWGLLGMKEHSNKETAELLGISHQAASLAACKALKKCQQSERIDLSRNIKHETLRRLLFGE